MIGREEAGLKVVDDHRVKREQLLGCLRKAVTKFVSILRVESNQDGLIVALRLFVALFPKPAIDAVAGFSCAAAEIERSSAAAMNTSIPQRVIRPGLSTICAYLLSFESLSLGMA